MPGTRTESKTGESHYFNEISPALLYYPGSSHTCLSHFTQPLSGSQLMELDFRKNPAILSNMVDVMADGSLYLSNEKKIGIS
jgi:hypothetical protein